MTRKNKFTKILLAIAGCVCIVLFFAIVSNSKTFELFAPRVSKSDILTLADEAFQNSKLADYDLRKEINLDLNKNLSKYAQLRLDSSLPDGFFPISVWEVEWRGKVLTKKEGEVDVRFRVKYDFDGNLIEIFQDAPHLRRPPNFGELDDAQEAALDFLQSQGIDPSAITLRNNVINKDGAVLIYDFAFSKPSPISDDLKETYEVNIAGRNIMSYQARVSVDAPEEIFPKKYRTSEIVAIIMTIAVWLIIGLFLLVLFFKRLRHDVLEFKRAFRVGVAVFLMIWLGKLTELPPDWTEFLLGGALSGFFAGLALILVYSVTDSVNRENWKEREKLTDILFQGFFRIKEFGAGLLDSLFIPGLTLLTFGVLFWLTGRFSLGYLDFDNDLLWIFNRKIGLLSNTLGVVIGALFAGLVLFSFWFGYLRSKIKSNAVLVLLFAIFLNLAGLHLYHIRPTYLGFFLLLPVACLWSYHAFKNNFVSLFISLFVFHFFFELALVNNLPQGFFSVHAIAGAVLMLLLLASGSYIINSKVSVKDFEQYVPEYVSRIAEKERFLKELEIARTVQLRFLPDSIPEFSNLEIACICKPAMEVGGDYYDFVTNGDGSLGIIIGDVSGKGVSAAFYMTMAKGIIKTLAKKTSNPKDILTEMNQIFYENAPKNVFISLIYGLFDHEKKRLTFARAGHNPIIVRKKHAQKPESLKPNGLAIGLEKGQLFSQTIEEASIPLEEDDIFVLFTDGISEAMNKNGDEFGEERLQNIISQNGHSSANDLLEKITLEVTKFAGKAEQHDDITMVVVKVG